MCKIPLTGWIANAAAHFSGDHGAVTRQAQEVHCSRQSVYDHAQKVYAAVAAEHSGGPSREQLIQENQALREENTQLWNWLSLTIEFSLVKQHEFSAVALGMGLSLTQIAVLLALLLEPGPGFGVGRGFAIRGPFPVQAPDKAPETCTRSTRSAGGRQLAEPQPRRKPDR